MASRSLSAYLLKKRFKSPAEAVRSDLRLNHKRFSAGSLERLEVYARPVQAKRPTWVSFFSPHVEPDFFGRSTSPSAVLFVPIEDRWVALTFGYGRNLLVPESWEENFGLLVAINAIEEGQIRSIDKKAFDAYAIQTREQAVRDAATADFGLDVERDLLKAVTGTPTKDALGKQLSGKDALRIHLDVEVENMLPTLELIVQTSQEEGYKERFPWIDQLAEVRDSTVKDRLNSLLLERIAAEDLETCWLGPPNIVDWGSVQGFKYSESSREPTHFDVHLRTFLDSLSSRGTLNISTLKRKRVFLLGDDDSVVDSWPVFRCVYCEISDGGKTYVLSEGKWYKVASDFLEVVNSAFERIPRYTHELPAYDDDSEKLYNERVALENPSRFALLDCKMIAMDGARNSVELCDLISTNKDLIHVKRYRSSSSLSHLFSQGLVAAECFLADSSFRRQLNQIVPGPFQLPDPLARPVPQDYCLVYAIISRSPGELKVPFFSRLTVRHAARRLQGFGYRVALAKISVAPLRSVLKKYS